MIDLELALTVSFMTVNPYAKGGFPLACHNNLIRDSISIHRIL